MRFYDLKDLSDKEANHFILESEKIKLRDILTNPESLSGKILIFRGNYDGFATNRMCARTFKYLQDEKRWEVADVTIYDMFHAYFDHHFLPEELESQFKPFCDASGFIMDA